MKLKIMYLCIVASGLFIATAGDHLREQEKDYMLEAYENVIRVLRRATSIGDIKELTDEYKRNPSWAKIWIAKEMKSVLRNWEACDIRNYERKENTHDLRVVAGRAALALEYTLGLKLPVNTEQAEDVTEKQERMVEERMENLIAEENKKAINENIIKKKYQGRIVLDDFKKAEQSFAIFIELLEEWFPIGKRLGELELITGVTLERDENDPTMVYYTFDTGDIKFEMHFVEEEGFIKYVYLY